MVQLQIISKVLATQDNSIISNNLLTEEYFVGFENEYNFIQNHIQEYGNVPDVATFLSKFPEMELVEVAESDRYLLDTIREEYQYYQSVPIVQQFVTILKTDANAAAEYMQSMMDKLNPSYTYGGIDIVSNANERYDKFVDRKENPNDWFYTTGFEELDEITHGLQRGEELLVIVARTNEGKSWVLEKIATHIWQLGENVGFISAEMGPNNVGYRFDTLHKNFSNKGLTWGKDDIKNEEYKSYIDELITNQNKFLVASPKDFQREITVSKLKQWIQLFNIQFLAIDGITYLSDERYKKGDNKTTSLTNISEDLMALSCELNIPIAVVVQANRSGVKGDEDKGTPELESIRDSDGIAFNASKVISIRQLKKENILEIGIKKQRNGSVGGKLKYHWNIDIADFQFIPSYDDAEPKERTERKVRDVKKKYKDKEDVF